MSGLRLRHIAAVNPPIPCWDSIPDDEMLTFVPLEAVWPGRVDYSRQKPKSEVASGYTRFAEGDVIVPKITPTFEADRSTVVAGMPTRIGTGTTELHVIRPSAAVDARYVNYLVSSRMFLHGGEAEMIGVAGQKRVPDAWLRNCPVPVGSVGEQRAIADFLDQETARIDALVAAKRRMIELLWEQWQACLNDQIGTRSGLKLKHLLSAPLAYGVLVPRHDPDGVPMLRIMDLRSGEVDLATVSRIPQALSQEFRRTIVRAGDLIVSVVGTLGRAFEVTPVLQGANLNRPLARVQLLSDVSRQLLRWWFESEGFLDQAHLATAGDSAQPTLGLGDLKNFAINLPLDRAQWLAIEERLNRAWGKLDAMRSVLTRQIELLVEHRQALITAAVTGHLEIPGVAA